MPDAATVHACTVLSSSAFGAMFVALWLIRGRATFYLLCAAASFSYAISLVGLALPGRGLLLSCLLCAGLGLYNSYMLAAVRSFEGERLLDPWTIAPPVLSAGAFILFAGLPYGVAAGRIGNSVALGVSTLAIGVLLSRTRRSRAPRSRRIVALIQFAYMPGYVASVALAIVGDARADWLALIPLLSDQLLLGVLNIALLAMPGERAEAALRDAALRDPLTGAWNRAGLAEIERQLRGPSGVILLDIDHFKQVNDRHGHAAGDAVLVALTRGAEACLPAGADIVRLGGDEFAVVLGGDGNVNAARATAEALRAIRLPQPDCTISLGMAMTLPGEAGLAQAMSRADAMLYRAKSSGRDRLAA